MKFKFKGKEVEIKYKSSRIKYCYIWAGILEPTAYRIVFVSGRSSWQGKMAAYERLQ